MQREVLQKSTLEPLDFPVQKNRVVSKDRTKMVPKKLHSDLLLVQSTSDCLVKFFELPTRLSPDHRQKQYRGTVHTIAEKMPNKTTE